MRDLFIIANEIYRDWQKPYFGAIPYLKAMYQLKTMNDFYGQDSAHTIITYFLANAATWRGETAKRIKKELNDMLKGKILNAQILRIHETIK